MFNANNIENKEPFTADFIEMSVCESKKLKLFSFIVKNLCEITLSDGSDLLAEEMKIGMKFYIHYSLNLFEWVWNLLFLNKRKFVNSN